MRRRQTWDCYKDSVLDIILYNLCLNADEYTKSAQFRHTKTYIEGQKTTTLPFHSEFIFTNDNEDKQKKRGSGIVFESDCSPRAKLLARVMIGDVDLSEYTNTGEIESVDNTLLRGVDHFYTPLGRKRRRFIVID